MFDLNKIIRANILKLKPYASARDEFSGKASIYLDANENAYGSVIPEDYSRYPDPKHLKLRKAVSEIKDIIEESIFAGSGSDEAIDLIVRLFCVPGKDKILTLHPSYGMYQVSADTNDIAVKTVNLNPDYTLNADTLISEIDDQVKVIFICNPNNPTGNAFDKEDLLKVVKAALNKNKIIVIDEAYIDFCENFSLLKEVRNFPNLIVLQTLSKAWGLAEIRLGLAFSSKEIISYLYKIKAPYNVNGVTQKIALRALSKLPRKNELVKKLITEREFLVSELSKLDAVEKVYKSDANYIFVKVKKPDILFKELIKKGIVVRDRSKVFMCEGCFRITVGTHQENSALIAVMAGKKPENSARSVKILRKTSETNINVKLNLDGSGESAINTGIGFLDHMLTQIARHAGVDLEIYAEGDLQVDEHHLTEDIALALGEAFNSALGDKKGIERYGFLLPMDESLAQVAIDFSGRSCLVWDAEFKREKIGEMPAEMFKHFFKSFSDSAKCNLNIKVSGENEHHKIEAIFKAFAKSIKQAIKKDVSSSSVPSTKGTL